MPIVLRQRSPSFSDAESDLENIAPDSLDPDDSIVLSDLVRTGEASRLRRRGAMRLDHSLVAQTAHPARSNPPVVVVDSPSWDSDLEDPPPGPVLPRERLRSIRPSWSRRVLVEEGLSFTYTLFCGAEFEDEDDEGELVYPSHSTFEPSVLPLYPLTPPTSLTGPLRTTRTNGCGAMLHLSAAPRQRKGIWLAASDATDIVVPIDASYFDPEFAPNIVRRSCGCLREGVGCAVCGNPLGFRFRGCKTSDDGSIHFFHKPPSPILTCPEGPQYWRALASHNSHSACTYTFFSNAVSSSPYYKFPPRRILESRPSITTQDTLVSREPPNYDTHGLQPTYNNTLFDRVITASSTPGEDVREMNDANSLALAQPLPARGLRPADWTSTYDPDGELLDEPSSPDKTNDLTTLLLPER